jgi:hypothetical protein
MGTGWAKEETIDASACQAYVSNARKMAATASRAEAAAQKAKAMFSKSTRKLTSRRAASADLGTAPQHAFRSQPNAPGRDPREDEAAVIANDPEYGLYASQ